MQRVALTALVVGGTLAGLVLGLAVGRLPQEEPVAEVSAPATPAPPQASSFEVRLESQYGPTAPSDPHAPFSGGCWANGSYATVAGTTPRTYTAIAPLISCTFQKTDGTIWPLKATVLRDGVAVQHVTTTTEYGVVSFVV